jgi:hypothetical protein
MAESKYGKYIIYQTEASAKHAPGSFPGTPVMNVNSEVIKGGFYFECIWFTGTVSESDAFKPHYHDFDEYIGMFGSNADDPFNLCAEVEFWFDDEKHTLTRSCVIFVPKGVWHTPIIIKSLDRPMFCLSTAPTLTYGQHVNRDPKWSHLKDPPESEVVLD